MNVGKSSIFGFHKCLVNARLDTSQRHCHTHTAVRPASNCTERTLETNRQAAYCSCSTPRPILPRTDAEHTKTSWNLVCMVARTVTATALHCSLQFDVLKYELTKDSQHTAGEEHFMAQWLFYVPPGLTFSNSTFCPQCIYVFCVDISTNSDYFPIQH